MIADTTFLSDLIREQDEERIGPARTFFVSHRRERLRTTIVSAGEIIVSFPKNADGWAWLASWTI
ncbi:MAG: hypothetical protein ACREFR_10990, partial [Limisphaerales bacterium]